MTENTPADHTSQTTAPGANSEQPTKEFRKYMEAINISKYSGVLTSDAVPEIGENRFAFGGGALIFPSRFT